MNARETCKHGNNWRDCSSCINERLFLPLDPMEAWRNARREVLPTGGTMTTRQYLDLAMTMPLEWLKESTTNPSPHMTPFHILLCKVAIRRLSK